MKKHTVTQKQIAKRAGVSQTLVSLALNNSYDVALSEETRQRVLDVASEMGYVPQAAARSLAQGHTNTIGLVLVRPHHQVFRDPYIPNVITGLVEVLRRRGYRLMVEHIDDLNNVQVVSDMLKGGEVAGVVLSGETGVERVFAHLVEVGYPIVVLNESSALNHTVRIDHANGIRSAVDHMIGLGHRHVAAIHYGPDNDQADWRLGNLHQTLASHNIAVDPAYIRFGEYDPESGYRAMQGILQLNPRPTALFGMNDMMAIGAMRAIHETGLRIPQDIAVIGYDDMRFAAFTNPSLTTVRAPESEQGRQAAMMILKLIEGQPTHDVQTVLSTKLIVRASCGGAAS